MLRHNPSLNKNRDGELSNPQYDPWATSDPSLESTLWLHTTDFSNLEEKDVWLSPNFRPAGERFYIGGGANTEFGSDLVFVRYRPREIFDFDNIDRGFIDCAYEKLVSAPSDTQELFISLHVLILDLPHAEAGLSDFDEQSIRNALKTGLESGHFTMFEAPYIQECLLEQGYTAYYESEVGMGVATPWEHINLAILKPDFDRVKVVAIAPHIDTERGNRYRCSWCTSACTAEDIIQGTLRLDDGRVMCDRCSQMEECTLCGERTDDFAVYEKDHWGDVERAICYRCEDYRKCESCEEYFEEDELKDRLCSDCSDEDESRDNPYPLYTDCEDAFLALKQYMEDLYIPKEIAHIGHQVTEFVRDVPFIHNLQFNEGADPYEQIKGPHSLLGKVTPERLFLSNIVDAYARGNGYLFAYDTANEGRVARSSRYYIEGVASHAVRFFHGGDAELQLIVPIKCITSMEIKDRGPSLKDNFDPYFEQGISVSDRTGVRPRHLMGGIIGELQPLCPVCMTQFSDVDMTSPEQLRAYPNAWRARVFGVQAEDSNVLVCGKCKGDPEWRDPTPRKTCLVVTPNDAFETTFRYYNEIERLLSPEFWEDGVYIEVMRSRDDPAEGFVYCPDTKYGSSPINTNPVLPEYIRALGIRGAVVVGDYDALLWTPNYEDEF